MTVAVRLEDLGDGWTSEAERSQMEADAATSIETSTSKNIEQDGRLDTLEAEKIGPPWEQDPASGDLYPLEFGAGDPGIGSAAHPVSHVAFGHQGEFGSEGFLHERGAADGGGLLVVAYRGVDPDSLPGYPYDGNAYLELNGSATLIATGGLWLQLSQTIAEDHEVIIGPSVTLPDGRFFSPLKVGPEKIYQHSQQATDALDYNVLDQGEVEIVSMTLTNDYTVSVSTFSYSVQIDNPGNKDTTFQIIVKVDGLEVTRRSRTLNQNSVNVSDSATIQNALSVGQVVSLDVQAESSHASSQGWVRGTVSPTSIKTQQG